MTLLLFTLFILFAATSGDRQYFDLTHRISPGLPNIRTYENQFQQSVIQSYLTLGSRPQSFCAPEDVGTHLNAPFKTNDVMWKLNQIPLENLIAPLIIIRFKSDEKRGGRTVQKSDIENWEREHNMQIPSGSVVVLDSDWDSKWTRSAEYLDISKTHHYPGFDLHACKYLVDKKVVGVGVDTMAIDGGANAAISDHACQNYLSDNNVYVLENVKDLSLLPIEGATIFVGALNMVNATGSPARIFAYTDSGTIISQSWWVLITVSCLIMFTR